MNQHSQTKEELIEITELCRVEEKATASDMKLWLGGSASKSRIVNCLEACLAEKMGMVIRKLI